MKGTPPLFSPPPPRGGVFFLFEKKKGFFKSLNQFSNGDESSRLHATAQPVTTENGAAIRYAVPAAEPTSPFAPMLA